MKATLRGRTIVEITGFTGSRADVEDAAWEMQQDIAELFEGSRTAEGPLAANSREYEVRKILDGMDPRRGHRTGDLQAAMYDVKSFRVTGSKSSGNWRIEFSDRAIMRALDYAQYFIDAKARTGKLMALNKRMVDAGVAVLKREQARRDRAALKPVKGEREVLRVARGVATRRALRDGVARTGVRHG